jgi:hypothetical protein
MIEIALRRSFSGVFVDSSASRQVLEVPARDGKIKAPTTVGRMWLVVLGIFGIAAMGPAGACRTNASDFNPPSAISRV